MSNGKEISVLVKARYPLIYVVSWEEERVIGEIRAGISNMKGKPMDVSVWKVTTGWIPGGEGKNNPAEALDYILNASNSRDDGALYILTDFHPYMKDPIIVRKLRDVAQALTKTTKTALILSPNLYIPPEMSKEITVADYSLPDVGQVGGILEDIISGVKSNPKITKPTNKAERETIIKACLGLTTIEIENALSKSLVEHKCFDINSIIKEKEQIIRKSGILEFYSKTENMANVGGLARLKLWANQRMAANSDRARDYGLPAPKGVLLVGYPGGGKSLCAKAFAGLWQLPLLRLDVGKVFTGLVGGSEQNMRNMIDMAEAVAPCILWIDEIEKGFAGVSSSDRSDAGTTAKVFGSFITWMAEKTSSVFVVATANDISQLPPELMRKGRFDEIFFVDMPTRIEREEIVKIHIAKRNRDAKKFDVDKIVDVTEGFVGAEIEGAVISAMYKGFDDNREFTTKDIVDAVNETVPFGKTFKEKIGQLRDWASGRARIANDPEKKEENRGRQVNV